MTIVRDQREGGVATTQPLRLYADGACLGNPGPGGWAYVLLTEDGAVDASGGEPRTTNQRMELTAAIAGLAATPAGGAVLALTDSQYVITGMNQWRYAWITDDGWRNSRGRPVANRALWEQLIRLADERRVTWRWVPGHTPEEQGGDPWNHRCDELANAAARAASSAPVP